MSLKVQLHIQKNLKNHNFAKVFLELENLRKVIRKPESRKLCMKISFAEKCIIFGNV